MHSHHQPRYSRSQHQSPLNFNLESLEQDTVRGQKIKDPNQGSEHSRYKGDRLHTSAKFLDLHAAYEADKDQNSRTPLTEQLYDNRPPRASQIQLVSQGLPLLSCRHVEEPSSSAIAPRPLYHSPMPDYAPTPLYSTQGQSIFLQVAEGANANLTSWPANLSVRYRAAMSETYPSPRHSEGAGGAFPLYLSIIRYLSPIVFNNKYSPSTEDESLNDSRSNVELPRNAIGEIYCSHEECSFSIPPTFSHKCEWT